MSHFQTQVVEIFNSASNVPTVLANALVAVLSSKYTVQQIFLRSWSQCSLNSVEYHIQEFLSILLDAELSRLSFNILASKAEIKWIEILSLCQFLESQHLLKLMKHIVIDHSLLVLNNVFRETILHLEHSVAEGRHHVELLDHSQHVANATKVS